MRNEFEMMEIILNIGIKDDNIRVVSMNGSRVDKNAKRDRYQDFDMVYLVDDLSIYENEPSWLGEFGEIAIMQKPTPASFQDSSYVYLMQFVDGNRIDLRLIDKLCLEDYLKEDSLTRVLVDKDKLIDREIIPSDKKYWTEKPSREDFEEVCNEFLWIATYVAKGICRGEIIYARKHLDEDFRPMLMKMLEWKAGIDNNFAISVGKYGKNIENFVSVEDYARYIDTYEYSSLDKIWNLIYKSFEYFKELGFYVGDYFDYYYPCGEHNRVLKLLKRWEEKSDLQSFVNK